MINPAVPTLAEGTIVERKGDDLTDRQAAKVLHFKETMREERDQADTTVTVDVPLEDENFLVVSKDEPGAQGDPGPPPLPPDFADESGDPRFHASKD